MSEAAPKQTVDGLVMRRRAEGGGFIRWFVNDECAVEVATDAYYREGHFHPDDCQCDALIHDKWFREKLRVLGFK